MVCRRLSGERDSIRVAGWVANESRRKMWFSYMAGEIRLCGSVFDFSLRVLGVQLEYLIFPFGRILLRVVENKNSKATLWI